MNQAGIVTWVVTGALAISLAGCGKATYPKDKIAASIQEICLKEYKIENVQVQSAGKTLGVFLPLKRLFAGDLKNAMASGKLGDPQALFSGEAMDQLEDVFFATSRVFMSTDTEIDFYILQATDIEDTGFSLMLTGYVPDVRRLRLWDIPRSEYRKRVLHELRQNRAVVWHKPVRHFFKQSMDKAALDVIKENFLPATQGREMPFLLDDFLNTLPLKNNLNIEIKEIKSRPYPDNQALVYVKFIERYEPAPGATPDLFLYPSGSELTYLFLVRAVREEYKIVDVISLNHIDSTGMIRPLEFPPQLKTYEAPEGWGREFGIEEVKLGDFLAYQLNRRAQEILLGDERVRHTLRQAQFHFTYHEKDEQNIFENREKEPYFSLHFDLRSKMMRKAPKTMDQVMHDEDVLYVLDVILRDFVDLMRSYRFEGYNHFRMVWDTPQLNSEMMIELAQLELFRKKKLNITRLLEMPLRSALPSLI